MNKLLIKNEYLEKVSRLKLFDDDFMNLVFDDEDCIRLLLSVIFKHDDSEIDEFEIQKLVKNLQGKSIELDIFVSKKAKKSYINIEVQRKVAGAHPKRIRFYASLIDALVTQPRMKVNEYADIYVVFIVEKDVFKKGLPIYHIDRSVNETGDVFKDGVHLIIVNGENEDDSPIGRLMHDFKCTDPDEMHYDVLASRVRYFKEEEGVEIMCEIWDEVKNEGIRKGKIEGLRKGKKIGKLQGEYESNTLSIRNVMKNLNLNVYEAMKVIGIKKEQYETYVGLLELEN